MSDRPPNDCDVCGGSGRYPVISRIGGELYSISCPECRVASGSSFAGSVVTEDAYRAMEERAIRAESFLAAIGLEQNAPCASLKDSSLMDEAVTAAAISDAAFDGRPFDRLGRADKDRYLERSRLGLAAAFAVMTGGRDYA